MANCLKLSGAPVGKRIARNPAPTKLAKKLNGAGDGECHLSVAVPPRLDEQSLIGETSNEFSNALFEWTARILLGVPLKSAHRREEPLNFGIRWKQLPIDQPRVPIDEDATEVKDCCCATRHCCAAQRIGVQRPATALTGRDPATEVCRQTATKVN